MPASPTNIVWTDYSANFWVGCAKVSEGCRNCWSAGMAARFGRTDEPWTINHIGENLAVYDEDFRDALDGIPGSKWVFCPSASDPFLPWLPPIARRLYFDAIRSTPQHSYQILTKWGPEVDRSRQDARPAQYEPRRTTPVLPPHAMLGVTVETPRRRYRLDWLREQQAGCKFVSFEPLIEEIPAVDLEGIDWAIIGGESHRAEEERREMDPSWAVTLYEECRRQDVAVLFKQHSGAYAEADRKLDVGDGPQKIEEFPPTPTHLPEAPESFL